MEDVDCHEMKAKKPQKEFDLITFSKLNHKRVGRNDNKEAILIKNIPGEG
jgi:hypothetical protein